MMPLPVWPGRGVSVQGRVSVCGGLCPGGSLSRGSLSRGLCPWRPPTTVKSERYASYWNVFLLIKGPN